MIEVEIKLPIFRRHLTENALKAYGFESGDLVKESDTYYTSTFHDFMARDEALRIRQVENLTTGADYAFITFKGPKMDTISMTRKELETKVDDASTMHGILLSLGYEELTPVKKLRQYYHYEGMEACVDQVEGLGAFLELEVIVETEEEREGALERMESVLQAIDSDMRETTRRSYLSMLQQKAHR